jgi:patatin-like phospholipase/acyl hydrolase
MLALDGGGIRGVLTLAMLKEIERQVGKPLGEYFDYIAGTSTGAIIATGWRRA